jgi:Tfp pilus assembly protein PilN
MLRLNLLAEEAKQKTKERRLFFIFFKAEVVLLLLVLASAAIFIAAEKILANNIQKSNQETLRLLKASSSDYNSRAKDINNKLGAIAKIQQDALPASRLLKNLTALIPAGVSLSYFGLDSSAKTIKIRGRAALRNDLLALEQNLENAAFLTKVDIPLQNKLKKENINFDINLGFDQAKLSAP